MTLKDHCYFLEAGLMQASDTNVALNGQVAVQIVNEAIQAVYSIALKYDPTVYQVALAFVNGTSFALPTNYLREVLIAVPTKQSDASATYSGAARVVDTRKFQTLLNDTTLGPTEDHPLATVKASTVEIRPTCAGTFYYIKTVPEVTDLTYDISAFGVTNKPMLIPWVFEPLVILHARMIGATREATKGQIPTDLKARYLAAASETKKAIDKAMEPYQAFLRDTVNPVQRGR